MSSSSNTENLDDLLTAELGDTILDDKTTSHQFDDNSNSNSTNASANTNNETTSANNASNENNDTNWLQKATSNVIQHAKKNVKIGNNSSSSESNNEALDESVIVPTPITSMMDDTENAQEQELWGMTSTSSSPSTATATATVSSTVSSSNHNSNQSKRPSLTYNNFTFSPPDNFVPISSCDELEPLPPTLFRDFNDKKGRQKNNGGTSRTKNNNESLKLSSNFSKLIANSKKVDLVRKANRKVARRGGKESSNGKDSIQKTTTPPMITSSKEADEYLEKNQMIVQDSTATTTTATNNEITPSTTTNTNNTTNEISQQKAINGGVAAVASLSSISVQKAQQNLIEQLKQGLDFLTSQNKHLLSHGDSLEQQIGKERKEFLKQLQEKQTEVEERNIKLAALEQHFMALNNLDNGSGGGTTTTTATTTTSSTDGEAGSEEKTTTGEMSETQSKSVKTSVSSSIVQIDKAYLNDLEKTVKLQKHALEKFEVENKTLKTNISNYTEELTKKERTIINLESTLKQGREARFSKKSKTHRRRATEGVIISNTAKVSASITNTPTTLTPAQSDDDSASNASSMNASNDNNNNKVDIEMTIATAVAEALAKQEKDHNSSMDVMSQQLDLKDKIIQRHEMKIYSLIHEKGGGETKSPIRQRHVPQDVMIRNISVTNELMDTSIRKLEKMMEQLELVEKEKRTDLADEISPIRRVATKVSLVHEEMKVAMKLIEQKVTNDVERIKQSSSIGIDNVVEKTTDEEPAAEDVKSGQTSGEGGDDNNNSNISAASSQQQLLSKSSIDDQIAEVFTESMKALKETEASVKSQIDDLTEQLQKIEFELAGKQDTIEALELACSEHVQNCRKMQEEIEQLKLGMMQV